MKTLKELERIAYMSNLPKIAALYAQLDDNERDECDCDREELRDKVNDLESDISCQYNTIEDQKIEIENLEKKLEKIADIVNE